MRNLFAKMRDRLTLFDRGTHATREKIRTLRDNLSLRDVHTLVGQFWVLRTLSEYSRAGSIPFSFFTSLPGERKRMKKAGKYRPFRFPSPRLNA